MSVAAGTVRPMLTDRERRALTLAATPFRHPAVRDTRALEELGLSPTRFWALVDGLLDRGDALAAAADATGTRTPPLCFGRAGALPVG